MRLLHSAWKKKEGRGKANRPKWVREGAPQTPRGRVEQRFVAQIGKKAYQGTGGHPSPTQAGVGVVLSLPPHYFLL